MQLLFSNQPIQPMVQKQLQTFHNIKVFGVVHIITVEAFITASNPFRTLLQYII